jgi:ABC-type transporter Mla maintaining outer membrane lipid asymmetry ATPase subunit MlaF
VTAPLRFERVTLPEWPGGVLTLEVPPHRAVMVLGSDAVGADDLMAFALALRRPPQGRVLVFGEDLATLPRRDALAARRRVGYLPAGNGLLYNLTLRDNVALPLRFASALTDRQIRGRLQVILGLLGLADAEELRPAEASIEQRRRAALARALAFDPELVLLEQPFDGLTDRAAAELLELARGGETPEGCRRTVFITGPSLPPVLRTRVEGRYRLARGRAELEEA